MTSTTILIQTWYKAGSHRWQMTDQKHIQKGAFFNVKPRHWASSAKKWPPLRIPLDPVGSRKVTGHSHLSSLRASKLDLSLKQLTLDLPFSMRKEKRLEKKMVPDTAISNTASRKWVTKSSPVRCFHLGGPAFLTPPNGPPPGTIACSSSKDQESKATLFTCHIDMAVGKRWWMLSNSTNGRDGVSFETASSELKHGWESKIHHKGELFRKFTTRL